MNALEATLTVRIWLSARLAAKKADVSSDTILRRGIPWQEEPVPGRIRYKNLRLGPGSSAGRRYFDADVPTASHPTANAARSDQAKILRPVFGAQLAEAA